MGRRRDWQRWVVVALVLLVSLAMILSMGAAYGTPRASTGSTAGQDTQDTETAIAGPTPELVVIGTSGLRWEDLTALATPNLWDLAAGGASANLVARSVRSSACPADGWLAVSAGRRAADVPMDQYGTCRRLLAPDADGAVPAWESYLEAAESDGYEAQPGLLGDLLTEQEVPVLAAGPGAAVALATSEGVVAGDHLPASAAPERLTASLVDALPGHRLAVVDVGAVRDHNRPLVSPAPAQGRDDTDDTDAPDPDETPEPAPDEAWMLTSPERAEQVATIDARVGAVLDAVRAVSPGTTIVLASLADSGSVGLMQVAVAQGPGIRGDIADHGGRLGSRSTRQPGIVQSTDLTPTILQVLGVDPPTALVGSPVHASPDHLTVPARIATLVDANDHAVAVRPLRGPFHSGLVLVNLLLYAAVTVGLNRRILDRAAAWFARRRSASADRVAAALRSRRPGVPLRAVRAAAVAVAAVPVSSYLANLLPWWRAGQPGLVLFGTTLLLAGLLAAVALVGPWRHRLLAPVGVVAGLTAAMLAVDVVTGATLQVSSLMGIQPEVGGRFYGFNNSSFSLFAASTILVGTCVADPLVRGGRRRLAGGLVLGLGAVAVLLVGHPSLGADFGGPPALIPGMLMLALLVAGVRLTWRRVAVVLGVTALLAASFSLLDWLRPPDQRTHLGRFVETVLDGGLWSVVGRKLEQNLSNLFGSTLTFLAIGGIVVVVVLLTWPLREAARSGEAGAYGWLTGQRSAAGVRRLATMLRPALVALGVTFAIAFAVNDSGVVLPAIGISLAVPLLVAVLTGWLLGRTRDPQVSGVGAEGSVDRGPAGGGVVAEPAEEEDERPGEAGTPSGGSAQAR